MSEWHLKADSLRIDDIDSGDGFVVLFPPADEEAILLTAPKPTYPEVGGFITIGARVNGSEDISWADEYGIIDIEASGGGGGEYFPGNGLYFEPGGTDTFMIQDTLEGPGTEIMWVPAKYSFRAGNVTGTQWAAANIGDYSMATGYNSTASGVYSIAHGRECTANTWYSMAFGSGAISTGVASLAMGTLVQALNYGTVALGAANVADGIGSASVGGFENYTPGQYGFSTGWGCIAGHYAGVAIGTYNISTGVVDPVTYNVGNKAFQIGIGTGPGDRRNALEVRFDGKGKLNVYGDGTITGTPTYSLAVDADGNIIEVALGLGGELTTADNGLTETSNNIQLGGTLIQDTTIDAVGFQILITGTETGSNAIFSAVNSSTGGAILGQSVSGTAVGGIATSGIGMSGSATNGTGIFGYATEGIAEILSVNPANADAVVTVARWQRQTSGTAAAGIGASLDMSLEVDDGNTWTSNQVISKWLDSVAATRTSEFSINGVNNALSNVLLKISGAGIFTLVQSLNDHVDDAAAATGNIPVNALYRTGSTVKLRVS